MRVVEPEDVAVTVTVLVPAGVAGALGGLLLPPQALIPKAMENRANAMQNKRVLLKICDRFRVVSARTMPNPGRMSAYSGRSGMGSTSADGAVVAMVSFVAAASVPSSVTV